jgi:hypothetical protein
MYMPASENHGRLYGFRFYDKLGRPLCSQSLQECKWRELPGSVTVDDTLFTYSSDAVLGKIEQTY